MGRLVFAALIAGCAAPTQEAELAPMTVAARPPRPQSDRSAPRFPRDPELSTEVDLRVVQFVAERRQIAESQVVSARKRFWPEKIRSVWSGILLFLDEALDRAPGDFPAPLLLRTNVELEAELDLTVTQYGKMPSHIGTAYDRVRKHIRRHLRSPESPSIETRAPLAFRWPIAEPIMVTSPFGDRQDPILDEGAIRFHAGVDLAGVTGDMVVAAAPGRVTFAGWLAGTGNTVMVRHPNGWVSIYGHLAEVLVAPRAHVAGGTPVGLVGNTGRSTGPHLHFELRKNGVHVDPQQILQKKPPT